MTRVAIVGTSNIGSIKYAVNDIAQEFPEIALTFFGLPGGRFDQAFCQNGVFGPPDDDAHGLDMARQINGKPRIDLRTFDVVFVVGDTFGLPRVLWLSLNHDVAEWPGRRSRPLMSEATMKAAVEEIVAIRVAHLVHQFNAIAPLYSTPAPYPTVAVVPRGPHHQQPYAGMNKHPQAARLQGLFQTTLNRAMARHDIQLVPQPQETIAKPFLTLERYGIGSRDFRSDDGSFLNDHRHMNPAFGTSLFRAFALTLPQIQDADPS